MPRPKKMPLDPVTAAARALARELKRRDAGKANDVSGAHERLEQALVASGCRDLPDIPNVVAYRLNRATSTLGKVWASVCKETGQEPGWALEVITYMIGGTLSKRDLNRVCELAADYPDLGDAITAVSEAAKLRARQQKSLDVA